MKNKPKFPNMKKREFPEMDKREFPKMDKCKPKQMNSPALPRNRTKRTNGNNNLEFRLGDLVDSVVEQYAPVPVYSSRNQYR